MKKFITWLCIISLLLLLLFYAVSAAAEKDNGGNSAVGLEQHQQVLLRARALVLNPDDGLEQLVRSGTDLLSKGPAWEPLARKKLRAAASKAMEIEALISPFIPPVGVSTLRQMSIGLGDRVLQVADQAPFDTLFIRKLPMQKARTKGEIIGGPRMHAGNIYWLVRSSLQTEGWIAEHALLKEFSYDPTIIGTACWIQGNVLTYRLVANLRVYVEDEIQGERQTVIKDMLGSIIAAYECALGMFSLPQSVEKLGANEAARFREIIKKNFPIMQEQQQKSQKKSSEARLDAVEEKEMIKAILGDSEAREKKARQQMLVPIPQREGDPSRKFSPGNPVGIH